MLSALLIVVKVDIITKNNLI